MAPAAWRSRGPGHDDVVLERAGGARVADLRVEVGADAAAALAVEEGDVDNAQMPTILVDPQPRTMDGDARRRDARAARRASATSSCMKARAGCPTTSSRPTWPTPSPSSARPTSTRERIARAPALRAVINVEGNFLRNVDYEACFARGIHVLVASPASPRPWPRRRSAWPSTSRAASRAADRAMRAGTEAYEPRAPTRGCFLLAGSDVGVVGLGDLGRELVRLLAPFRCRVRAYDPWLPELAIRAAGAEPAGLDELLRASRVVFVFAAPTTDNQAMLGRRELELLPDGAALLVMSRAAVVDLDALVELAAAGRLRAAVDVWPREPVPADHPARARRGPAALAPSHRRHARGLPGHRRGSWWPTSSWCCAGCRRSPAGAPSARPSARLRSRPIDEPE